MGVMATGPALLREQDEEREGPPRGPRGAILERGGPVKAHPRAHDLEIYRCALPGSSD